MYNPNQHQNPNQSRIIPNAYDAFGNSNSHTIDPQQLINQQQQTPQTIYHQTRGGPNTTIRPFQYPQHQQQYQQTQQPIVHAIYPSYQRTPAIQYVPYPSNNNNNNNNDDIINRLQNIVDIQMKEVKQELNTIKGKVNIANKRENKEHEKENVDLNDIDHIMIDGEESDNDESDVKTVKILRRNPPRKCKKKISKQLQNKPTTFTIKITKKFTRYIAWAAINYQTASSVTLEKDLNEEKEFDSKQYISAILCIMGKWHKSGIVLKHCKGYILIEALKKDQIDINNKFVNSLICEFGPFKWMNEEKEQLLFDMEGDDETECDVIDIKPRVEHGSKRPKPLHNKQSFEEYMKENNINDDENGKSAPKIKILNNETLGQIANVNKNENENTKDGVLLQYLLKNNIDSIEKLQKLQELQILNAFKPSEPIKPSINNYITNDNNNNNNHNNKRIPISHPAQVIPIITFPIIEPVIDKNQNEDGNNNGDINKNDDINKNGDIKQNIHQFVKKKGDENKGGNKGKNKGKNTDKMEMDIDNDDDNINHNKKEQKKRIMRRK